MLPIKQLLLCACDTAIFCSELCASQQTCPVHVDAKRAEPPTGSGESKPKRRRPDPLTKPVEQKANELLNALKKTPEWIKGTDLARYRLLQSDARLPASALISVLEKLRPPRYYPHILHNQAITTQPRLDLTTNVKEPIVVAVLAPNQRLLADTWAPWSGVRGGYAEWDTGLGKASLIHAVGKNYRHEQVWMPNLLLDSPEKRVLQGRIMFVITESHLRADVMKDFWAQGNRDPVWITAQIRAMGLCADEDPTPFTAVHVLSGRQLTNAMAGVGPIGKALWSGLLPGEHSKVKVPNNLKGRVPTAYRLAGTAAGETNWTAFDMPWSSAEMTTTSLRITTKGPLSAERRARIRDNLVNKLPNFPSHWAANAGGWKAGLQSLQVEIEPPVGSKGPVRITVQLLWKSAAQTPSDVDWTYYVTITMPEKVVPRWGALAAVLRTAKFSVLSTESDDASENRGFEMIQTAPNKYSWVTRRNLALPEVRYNPFQRGVFLIDEAAAFFSPEPRGGNVPNLELFYTVIRESPGMRVFYFTAAADLLIDMGIMRTLLSHPGTASEDELALPNRGLQDVQVPNFSRIRKLSFDEIRSAAGDLLKGGDFNRAELLKLKNASKGLVSVGKAINRDHFAEVRYMEPRTYRLPDSHSEYLLSRISRISATNFGQAILCAQPNELPPEVLLRNLQQFNPDLVIQLLMEGRPEPLLPGLTALLLQLREFDSMRGARYAKQAVFSTLRNDGHAIDLYAAGMQAAGYRWVMAKKRVIDRSSWTRAQQKEYEKHREAGTVPPELREVYLDFERPLATHFIHDEFARRYGPLNTSHPHDFVVLSESLLVSDTELVEPQTFAELRERARRDTDTLFTFRFTTTELRASGFVLAKQKPAASSPEAEREEYTSQAKEFKDLLSAVKKHHLHLWPGNAYAEHLHRESILEFYKKRPEHSFFVLRLDDGVLKPYPVDRLLDLAGFPPGLEERFQSLHAGLIYNFTLSDYQQRDLLTAITESWNNSDNAHGEKARFILYGGNYLQGYDLKNTLFSTALHPTVSAYDEQQARGRTNRRNGMPDIPFLERVIHHATLVANWTAAVPTLENVFPPKKDDEGEEIYEEEGEGDDEDVVIMSGGDQRYGQMAQESAVISAVYDNYSLEKSHILKSNSPVQPYEAWRCKTEAPSVTAFRQAGHRLFKEFAMDINFAQLKRDQSDPDLPDSTVPIDSWVKSPTQWVLKRSAVERYFRQFSEDIVKQEALFQQRAHESSESNEQYEARILSLIRQESPAFDGLPEKFKQSIIMDYRMNHPQHLVSASEPQELRAMKAAGVHLATLLDVLREKPLARILRRTALETKHRFLVLDTNPFYTLDLSAFGLGNNSLEQLFEQRFVIWNPDIQRIKTEAELVEDERTTTAESTSDGDSDPKRRKVSDVYTAAPMLVEACPSAAEVEEALKTVKESRPFSNVLEALGVLDSEQDAIESHLLHMNGELNMPFYLTQLRLWNSSTEQMSESQLKEAIYSRENQPQLLKEAIMELSKFGLTNWRSALRCIAAVYLSERLRAQPQSLKFVAQLIGVLVYTANASGFDTLFSFAAEALNRGPLDLVAAYFQLLFQWSAAYTPWDRSSSHLFVAYALELTDLHALITEFQRRFELNILINSTNVIAFKRALFFDRNTVLTVPLQDVNEVAKRYASNPNIILELVPEHSAAWNNVSLKRFFREFRVSNDFEQARKAAAKQPLAEATRLTVFDRALALLELDAKRLPDRDAITGTKLYEILSHLLEYSFANPEVASPVVQRIHSIANKTHLSVDSIARALARAVADSTSLNTNRAAIFIWMEQTEALRWTGFVWADSQTPVFLSGPEDELLTLEPSPTKHGAQSELFSLFFHENNILYENSEVELDAEFVEQLLHQFELHEDVDVRAYVLSAEFRKFLVDKPPATLIAYVEFAKQFAGQLSLPTVFELLPQNTVQLDSASVLSLQQMLVKLQAYPDNLPLDSQLFRALAYLKSEWRTAHAVELNAETLTHILKPLFREKDTPFGGRIQRFRALAKKLEISSLRSLLAPAIVDMMRTGKSVDTLWSSLSNRMFRQARKEWDSANLLK